MTDLKEELHAKLQVARATMLSKLEGLSEYEMRRPMTPTGTNLLGLVKHLAGVEYVYLGDSLGRPAPERRETTLGVLLVRMVAETAQHAGHADIVREMIDGQAGNDANFPDDADWPLYVADVQHAADAFLSER